MHVLRAEQVCRHHPYRLTARFEHRIRNRPHHSLTTATVYEPVTGARQAAPQGTRGVDVGLIDPGSGATECAQALHAARATQSEFFKVRESEFKQ